MARRQRRSSGQSAAPGRNGVSESRSIAAVTPPAAKPGRFLEEPSRSIKPERIDRRAQTSGWKSDACFRSMRSPRSDDSFGNMTCAPSHAPRFHPRLPQAGRPVACLCAACVTFAGVMGRKLREDSVAHGRPHRAARRDRQLLWAVPRGCSSGEASGLLFNLGAYWFSDRVALMVNRAQPVSRDELPVVHEIVEELVGRAGMPIPGIYLIPSESPTRSPRVAIRTILRRGHGRNPAHSQPPPAPRRPRARAIRTFAIETSSSPP